MHVPVLLKEVIHYLDLQPGDTILDATVDGGGHAAAVCEHIGPNGKIIGIDQDLNIIHAAEIKFQKSKCKIILVNGNFRDLDKLIIPLKIKKLDGAIFDLGMSTLQLKESGRGFSFQKDEPLLMTFKSEIGPNDLTAKEIINRWNEKEIANVLYEYGEERYSRRIARGICEKRRKERIETTFNLVDIIRVSVPAAYRNNKRINCCTRTFQALRIAVNDELRALEEGIEKVWDLLSKKSRMVVISFHSLEDRIVKKFLIKKKQEGKGKILTKKPILPMEDEIKSNPRARSAKLRAMEKM